METPRQAARDFAAAACEDLAPTYQEN
jgi:hypothetical protein